MSPIGTAAFLLTRTTWNAARRRLQRLREPRYLLGSLGALAYFYFVLRRAVFGAYAGAALARRGGPLPDALAYLLLLSGAVLALSAAISWVFGGSRPSLALSEAEVQFLAPAPLPRRFLLHFALVRSELRMLMASLVLGLTMGRIVSPRGWPAAVGTWIVLSTMHLHSLGLSFWKAREREGGRGMSWRRLAVTLVAVLLGLTVLSWAAVGARLLVTGALQDLQGWKSGWVPRIVLAPFCALIAPSFAPDAGGFLRALPAALAILLAHYAWVVRINARYEEAAIAGARRLAEQRARLESGRLTGLPSRARRDIVPFPLRPLGPPEWAVLWKNLISRGRSRLGRVALGWVGIWAALFLASAVFVAGSPQERAPMAVIGISLTPMATMFALMLPLGYRNDFREDLEHAAALRAWPLSPRRLAAAELMAPLTVTSIAAWGFLGAVCAVVEGARAALAWRGVPVALDAHVRSAVALMAPGVLGLAVLLPAVSAIVLVFQNAAVLALPGWFPPGPRRRRFESIGTQALSLFGTMLVLLVALLPAALFGVPIAWLGWGLLGPWAVAAGCLVASLPIWAEVILGLTLLGRLFERFDLSTESWG
jgi:hypothetical protein